MTHSGITMVCKNVPAPCMRVLQSNIRDVVKGHNGLQQCACSNTVCQRHSMHRPFKHYKYSAFHISTQFRTIIAVQWMSLAHKYFGARGDFANRCELFDVSTIQTLQLQCMWASQQFEHCKYNALEHLSHLITTSIIHLSAPAIQTVQA